MMFYLWGGSQNYKFCSSWRSYTKALLLSLDSQERSLLQSCVVVSTVSTLFGGRCSAQLAVENSAFPSHVYSLNKARLSPLCISTTNLPKVRQLTNGEAETQAFCNPKS